MPKKYNPPQIVHQPKPPDKQPSPDDCPGIWNAYVEFGETKEIRQERLAQVPPSIRDRVRAHVKTFFALMAKAQKAQAEKAKLSRYL
jgi:hypothetical protein